MARPKKTSVGSFIDDMMRDLRHAGSKSVEVPDIITFVEHEDFLGLGTGPNPITLYPAQRIILKAFYRGSRGNENLELTEEEVEYCKKMGLDDSDPDKGRGDILSKYKTKQLFRELVLVWGRRSGKDFLVSIIALYEAMRLLEVPGGDPYKYYTLSGGADISILTIAASQAQAQIAFREIREKLLYSKYFSDKYVSEGITQGSISLQTPKDKKDNEYFERKGLPAKTGSVKIEVGHSNPDTLVGKSCFVLVLDEVASYRVGGSGAGSGDKIYALLQPAVSTYMRQIPMFDDDGNPIIDEDTGEQAIDRIYEGKIISISSPRAKEGKLWELWSNSSFVDNRLACRLPTWVVNTRHTEKSLMREFSAMSDLKFNMEFGAEFGGTGGESMFSPDIVKTAFQNNLTIKPIGQPGKTYFVHIDPATNSHNYALVVCHKEIYLNPETNKADFFIEVDFVKYWTPTPDRMIEVEEVDEFVISLKRRFHLGLVTYDSWNSAASIQKLKKNGIAAKEKKYNRKYKMQIYSELEELLKSERLRIPYVSLLFNEMIHLQRKYDANGFKIYPKTEEDVANTDDVVDALAGAIFNTISTDVNRLPSGRMVATGSTPSANDQVWQGMQGPIGVGPGQAVSNWYEKRNSWPMRKRI